MPFGVPVESQSVLSQPSATSATTLRVATLDDFGLWERDWFPTLASLDRYDAHFPWRDEIERARSTDGFLTLALARGASLDGLLSLSLQRGGSRLQPGQDVVYIEYVGVAPQHQRPPVGVRKLRGIGSTLVWTALELSEQVGCGYRVGLHSKPDSEEFYRARKFTELGMEDAGDGVWLYFEIAPENAKVELQVG